MIPNLSSAVKKGKTAHYHKGGELSRFKKRRKKKSVSFCDFPPQAFIDGVILTNPIQLKPEHLNVKKIFRPVRLSRFSAGNENRIRVLFS